MAGRRRKQSSFRLTCRQIAEVLRAKHGWELSADVVALVAKNAERKLREALEKELEEYRR
jgi:hypothetical protein